MWEKSAGIYDAVWFAMAMGGLWLLYRIFEILKALHFMMKKWFDRDYIIPFDKAHGIYDGDDD